MKSCFSYLISGFVLAGLGVVSAAGKVTGPAVQTNEYSWRQGTNSIALLNRGKVVWQLNYDKAEGKPYFHPLSTVDGSVLSWLRPGDHPWHRALWFSWKFIDGLNYWEEDGNTGLSEGRTKLTAVKVSASPDFSARIEMTLSYHPPQKEEVLSEKRIVVVSAPQADGCYQIDWISRFVTAASNVVLGRTPIPGQPNGVDYGGYAGLSLRMAKETLGWTFVDSEGREGAAIHGKQSAWVNVSGNFADGRGGVAILSHPANVRQPSSWYVAKDMPYFSPAVLFDEPLVLEKGKVLELKYRILVHGGAVDRALLGNEWKRYADVTRTYTLAEKSIQHAQENLPKQVATQKPELTKQVHALYRDCLFDKLWEPALPGLPYRFFSISGAGDTSYAKCQLLWDTMFILNAWAPLDDNELMCDVFRNYWNVIDNNPEAPKGSYRYGMVPGVTNPDLPQNGYSQIPILAWGCLMVFNQTDDRALLDLCVPYLDAFLTWYATERDVDDDGLIEYGAYKKCSIADILQTARFETFDFAAPLDGLKLTKHPSRATSGAWYGNIEGVDQTCFLAMSERAMIEICQRTGRIDMMKKYERNLAKRTEAVRAKMWDPETKFFYSLDRDSDKIIPVRTLQGFLPLTAGLASEKQAAELVKQLTDPSLFWSKFPVPTSAMNEPTFRPDGFWRGDMWPPTDYLIALGLNRYGYYGVAREIADKLLELVKKYDGHAYERYNGVEGLGLGVKDYCWGVTTWSIAVNTLYGVQEDYRTIVVPPDAKGRRLKLGKLEVSYPTDTSVELKTAFQREFKVMFPVTNAQIKVQCDGATVKSVRVTGSTSAVTFTALPGKTYRVSKAEPSSE